MDYPTEEWKPVVGYEGWYEVSSLGQVKRIHPYLHSRTGKVLTESLSMGGYRQRSLSRENNPRTRTVHSIVANAFLGPRPPRHDYQPHRRCEGAQLVSKPGIRIHRGKHPSCDGPWPTYPRIPR